MRLYKYLHPDRTDVLSRQRIRFTPPSALNDPFELKPNITAIAPSNHIDEQVLKMAPKILEEEISKLSVKLRKMVPPHLRESILASQMPAIQKQVNSLAQELCSGLRTTMEQTFEKMLGVLCLSERKDSLLMWAHYADSHKGFIVEFDASASFFDCRRSTEDELRHIRKVTYSKNRPSLPLIEIENFSPFLTKGPEWEYEAEWRMTQTLDCADQVIGTKPEEIHLFVFPAEAVRAIVFGCRMNDKKKSEIIELVEANPGYRNVTIQEAEIDQIEYRLRFRNPND